MIRTFLYEEQLKSEFINVAQHMYIRTKYIKGKADMEQ